MKSYSSAKGISLLEMLVVITIVALLATAAIPSLGSIVQGSQRRATVNEMLGFFSLARREAVVNGKIVTLCPLDPDNRCGRDWNADLHLFEDRMNTRQLASPDNLLAILPAPKAGYRKVRSLSRSYFQFRPNGMILSDLGNITWCPDSKDPTQAAQLLISRGGVVRVARDYNGDGIPDRPDGSNIKC